MGMWGRGWDGSREEEGRGKERNGREGTGQEERDEVTGRESRCSLFL